MQLFTLPIFLLLANSQLAESLCFPPSIPAKDEKGIDCCKLPSEPFPHTVIYEEFCDPVYFGIMAGSPGHRFCRSSSIQEKKPINCDSGWVAFFEGLNQFCYKAFSVTSSDNAVDVSSKKDGDPCEKQRKTARLVRVPNQNINMFLYVQVLRGELNISCTSVDINTYYYYIGLYREDFDWLWRPYPEKSYTHLEEASELLLDYLNSPRPRHVWSDGTRIFAKGWDNPDDISTNVVISNCGMWRDYKNSLTNFKYDNKHAPNQGYICAYHV